MARSFIAVASASHVRLGRAEGFMQVCHGKAAPLRRISPGDRVIYYSPTETFGGNDRLQAFTALGTAKDAPPYQVDMCQGFTPWRRNVLWRQARETPIRPLLPHLAFTRDQPNWGYKLRFGLFEIDGDDADCIEAAMCGVLIVSARRNGFSPSQDEAQLTLV
ncbi:EVE domain-containing protein [Oryzifoliimicrobium ureilyticus]|uniref:EVE domain-containing protein n=1 Tax=Oryzifoliimicrobium ureilyticus TaxID=3113724 RepID=UPI0030765522